MTRNHVTLIIIAVVAAAGLVDSGVSGTPVYADVSETSTEQKIKQEMYVVVLLSAAILLII
jgi:hypothetical protein